MHPIQLQDWITVRGSATGTIVKQPEDVYADLLGYQDVAIHTEVADFAGSPNIAFETAPTKDEVFFGSMASMAGIAAAGVTVLQVRYGTAATPVARWVRWRCSGTGVWSVTFRTWLVANPVRS